MRTGAALCVRWPVAELADRSAQRLADHPERKPFVATLECDLSTISMRPHCSLPAIG